MRRISSEKAIFFEREERTWIHKLYNGCVTLFMLPLLDRGMEGFSPYGSE
jgi:hypothetical protein